VIVFTLHVKFSIVKMIPFTGQNHVTVYYYSGNCWNNIDDSLCREFLPHDSM